MKTEIKNRFFVFFVMKGIVYIAFILGIIIFINYSVDASHVITAKSHTQMAKLALSGKTVAMPENYNERIYQVAIVNSMKNIPETVVIGSSRGMFLGSDITGFNDIYNNCVSGACIEDYYALLGLYYQKFSELPSRVILEVSPWVFYGDNPEARWIESYAYRTAAERFYQLVNSKELKEDVKKENPYLSLPYFQYNISVIEEKGSEAFSGEKASESLNDKEQADYSDGTIRYAEALEKRSEERLAKVQAMAGGVTYENSQNMTEINSEKSLDFESLIDYLLGQDVEVVLYLQPFSVTQCYYIFDEGLNAVFADVEDCLDKIGEKYNVTVVGGYDSREFGLTDEMFIDFMHLDKEGTRLIWEKKQ